MDGNLFGISCCDGLTRREALRIGGLGMAGLLLPDLLRAQEKSGGALPFGRARRCILLFMSGGPPQQDTWDLKPDAPVEQRGLFKPIPTSVAGIEISEYFPLLARQADKYAILRSVTHDSNIHTVGAHLMLTGNAYPKPAVGEIAASPSDFPHYGAVLTKLRPTSAKVPPFVALPQKNTNTDGTIWPGQGGGFLGEQYDPLFLTAEYKRHQSDPKAYENCVFKTPALTLPKGLTMERVETRRRLLQTLDRITRKAEQAASLGLLDAHRERAYDLLTSPETQRAFDLDAEPPALRDKYGRHLFGQSCLLARRLAAAGVPLVTVFWHPDGTPAAPSWDTHEHHYHHLKSHLMGPADRGFAALLEDLHQRGMLHDTLVVWMGEFGRTPQINANGGRDHWGMCQSIVMAGGGIRGGQVYGKSDRVAAYPTENPVSPGDVSATIYTLLGVPPEAEIVDQTGRPHPVTRGEPIRALF